MPERCEARSIIESAEQAAAAGNYASAEHFLREAAALQEQTLGRHHPDLANTLNNLGVVCEMTTIRSTRSTTSAGRTPSRPRRCRRTTRSWPRVARTFTISAWPADGRWSCRRHHRQWQPGWTRPSLQRQCASRRGQRRSRRDADPSEEILAPARSRRVERGCLLIVILTVARPWGSPVEETKSPQATVIAPVRQTRPRGQRLRRPSRSRDRNKPRSPLSPVEARTTRLTPGQYARKTGGDANGGYGATLHRSQELAMRGCEQPGSARADVFLHTGKVRNRHHD